MGLLEKMMKTYGGDRRPREKTAVVQKKRLASLVKTAKEKSPFYRELYAGIGDGFRCRIFRPSASPS